MKACQIYVYVSTCKLKLIWRDALLLFKKGVDPIGVSRKHLEFLVTPGPAVVLVQRI